MFRRSCAFTIIFKPEKKTYAMSYKILIKKALQLVDLALLDIIKEESLSSLVRISYGALMGTINSGTTALKSTPQ